MTNCITSSKFSHYKFGSYVVNRSVCMMITLISEEPEGLKAET